MKELTAIQKSAIRGMKRGIESLEKKRSKVEFKITELCEESECIDLEIQRAKKAIESYTECAYEDLFPEEFETTAPTYVDLLKEEVNVQEVEEV